MARPKKSQQSSALGKHEGQSVSSVSFEVRGIAGGLDEGLKIEPVLFHIGDEFTLVLRGRVKGVRFDEIKDSDDVKRVHVATAVEGMIIDDDLVSEAFEKMQARIEEASGIIQLPLRLQAEHDRGEHEDDPADGCPSCDPDNA